MGGAPYGGPAARAPAAQSALRSDDEMLFLYGAGFVYGVGAGIWVDSLFKVTDPGLAVLAPIAFGAAAPAGFYLWDQYDTFHRGVPASIATGIALGTGEGIGISATQWQLTRGDRKDWDFSTQSTITFLTATAGGVGGYAFGEWLRPDPRTLGFIASGAGWGALTGTLFGAGVSGSDWKDGASIAGLIGYNAGIVATGALSPVYVPSWETQKWLWAGYGAGVLASSVVYFFYLFSPNSDAKHGLIANSVGGLAGLGIAAVLTANMNATGDQAHDEPFKPPFQLGFAPLREGGGRVTASGTF